MYPFPPLPDASTQAALEVKSGDWLAALTWAFMFHGLWQAVDINGVRYSLNFATPTIIPVPPGYHHVMCFMYSPMAFWKGRPTMKHATQVQVAPGSVQPISYRMHRTTFGFLLNFKNTVLKVGMPRPFMPGMNNYGAQPMGYPSQPMPQYGMQPPQPQQPPHQYGMQPPQPVPLYAPQPELTQARFDSPFTDGDQAQPPAPQFAGKKFCTQCGTAVVAGNRFCGGCGQAVAV